MIQAPTHPSRIEETRKRVCELFFDNGLARKVIATRLGVSSDFVSRTVNEAQAERADFRIVRKTGRLASGNAADGGVRYHAVAGKNPWSRALCGTIPGHSGNGWSEWAGEKVTCPGCLKKMAKKA